MFYFMKINNKISKNFLSYEKYSFSLNFSNQKIKNLK